MTDRVVLTAAQVDELRDIAANPGCRETGRRQTRLNLLTMGLVTLWPRRQWVTTPAGRAWLEANP